MTAPWPVFEVDVDRDAERAAVAVWLGVWVREWPSGVIAAAA